MRLELPREQTQRNQGHMTNLVLDDLIADRLGGTLLAQGPHRANKHHHAPDPHWSSDGESEEHLIHRRKRPKAAAREVFLDHRLALSEELLPERLRAHLASVFHISREAGF